VSLYRQAAGSRTGTLAAIGVLGLLAGAIAGFALGRGTASEPTFPELAEELSADVRPALNALELVTIEYPEAVRGSEVVAETEYEAARSQAETAESTLASVSTDLAAVDPARAETAIAAAAQVTALIEDRADPGRVERAAEQAAAAIEAATPPS
jgi:hypothetical protein